MAFNGDQVMAHHEPHHSIECREPVTQSIQEKGPEPTLYCLILYDTSSSSRKHHGSFSLKITPAAHLKQLMSDMDDKKVTYYPKGFINQGEGCHGPMFYAWPVKILDHMDIQILILENRDPVKCRVQFEKDIDALKERVKVETILSRPAFSRLPTNECRCASVDFTINAGCEEICSKRFRVIAESDLPGESKCKDYNVLFVRDAPEPAFHYPGPSQLSIPSHGNAASSFGRSSGSQQC